MEDYKYSINTEAYIPKMLVFVNAVTGMSLDLKNPKTIQEKLAWLNIYDQNPLKIKCADKIQLHNYCKECLGKDFCVPILAEYNSANEIKWKELPRQFVLKCNHGSGMNIIIKDKNAINQQEVINQLNYWLNVDFSMQNGFEAHYHDIQRKIFAEQYLEDTVGSITDYKFLCFNGKPLYLQIIGDRFTSLKHLNYYDMEFNFVPDLVRTDFPNNPYMKHKKPKNFEQMKKYAKKLSKPFKFVRVDFYEIGGEIYLGEMTFTPGAFVFRYKNQNDELKIGKLLKL